MKFVVTTILLILSHLSFGQREDHLAFPEIDSLYREDQFYFSATFHVINQKPNGVVQSGFSGGLHTGFIRDIPFNKRRNLALGIGLGYSVNVYNHNLILVENGDSGKTLFRTPLPEDDIKNNRFRNQLIEVPIELRWRTSTPESYKFWRIYTGVRLGYMHSFLYESESNSGKKISFRKPDGLDRLRVGATMTFGFNTFNFHAYYGINPFFDDSISIIDGQGGFSSFKIGLMFYIL